MKNLIVSVVMLVLVTLVSCGPNPRVFDAALEGCQLADAYNKCLDNPDDGSAEQILYTIRMGVKMTVNTEGLDLNEVKELMRENCGDRADILDEALAN